jgi:hypothetical protein
MRACRVAVAVVVVAAAPVTAHAQAYTESFIGWSTDGRYYAISEAGTDGLLVSPALCLSRRGETPASWPKDIPLPDASDERGCTDTLDQVFDGQSTDAIMAKARNLVVAPSSTAPHGETVEVKSAGDGSIAAVTVSRGNKPIGRGYVTLRSKSVPDVVSTYWRADGLAVAVEAGYSPAPDSENNPGFGPPTYLVVIALDGSTANAARPPTARDRSRALNLEGMKLLKAGRRDEAQHQFVAATEADPSFSIAQYNLASVASLRQDSNTAVAAIEKVIDLARTDAEAKRALTHAKIDHDLDFIASQSPYVTQLLGRPRTAGDDWCIATEKRARAMNLGYFIAFAEQAGPVIASGARGAIRADKEPEFACFAKAGKSQLSITVYVVLAAQGKPDRVVTIAWQIFSDGFFDADAFLDDKHEKSVRLQSLSQVARISHAIATGAP